MKSKFTVLLALAAVLMSLFAAPAFAEGGDEDESAGRGPAAPKIV